jgi:hypothetical protein
MCPPKKKKDKSFLDSDNSGYELVEVGRMNMQDDFLAKKKSDPNKQRFSIKAVVGGRMNIHDMTSMHERKCKFKEFS